MYICTYAEERCSRVYTKNNQVRAYQYALKGEREEKMLLLEISEESKYATRVHFSYRTVNDIETNSKVHTAQSRGINIYKDNRKN